MILNAAGTRVLDVYRWGLIPSWAKDLKPGYKMMNARSETVAEKPAYRRLVNSRRCLVPADTVYEWQKSEDQKTKTPMRIFMKTETPFAMAGLWEDWRDAEGRPLRSYTILTTAANRLLKSVHDRMPVIVRPEMIEAWLDPGVKLDALHGVFDPYPEENMDVYPVSSEMNSPRHNGPG